MTNKSLKALLLVKIKKIEILSFILIKFYQTVIMSKNLMLSTYRASIRAFVVGEQWQQQESGLQWCHNIEHMEIG